MVVRAALRWSPYRLEVVGAGAGVGVAAAAAGEVEMFVHSSSVRVCS